MCDFRRFLYSLPRDRCPGRFGRADCPLRSRRTARRISCRHRRGRHGCHRNKRHYTHKDIRARHITSPDISRRFACGPTGFESCPADSYFLQSHALLLQWQLDHRRNFSSFSTEQAGNYLPCSPANQSAASSPAAASADAISNCGSP